MLCFSMFTVQGSLKLDTFDWVDDASLPEGWKIRILEGSFEDSLAKFALLIDILYLYQLFSELDCFHRTPGTCTQCTQHYNADRLQPECS